MSSTVALARISAGEAALAGAAPLTPPPPPPDDEVEGEPSADADYGFADLRLSSSPRSSRDPGMSLGHDVLLALIMAVAMGATVFLYR